MNRLLRPRRSWRALVCLALLAGAGPFGCSEDLGSGRVVGALSVPDCDEDGDLVATCPGEGGAPCEAFDLKVSLFALEQSGDLATIRLQRGGQAFAQTDGLLLQIHDVRRLRGNLGAAQRVGPGENIRAALGLFRRCPVATLNFSISGEVVFDRFGLDSGDVIAGSITTLEVRDGRSGEIGEIVGELHGEFEFTVRSGPPFQQFVTQ